MKRVLFFWMEKLEISKSERIAVTALMISATILSAHYYLKQPAYNDDPEYYAELEAMFRQKSSEREMERNVILARYNPEHTSVDSTLLRLAESTEYRSIISDDGYSDDLQSLSDPGKVNINKATMEELQRLPGIGPAYAQRIVDWREQNGQFTSIDQLLEIRGIGEKRLEKLRPYVKLVEEEQ